jgi:radical SAM superfamily enzyme YgiQ (UPF0313 family)
MVPEKSMGKVVLFNPSPWTGVTTFKKRVTPLALMHIAPYVEKCGYTVSIIDQFVDRSWRTRLSQDLSEKPVCFGVTSMTGAQITQALRICRKVKKQYPELPIVWGGIHATIKPAQTLENPFVDIVVIGEGEETFSELVQAIDSGSPLQKVNGIAFKKDGRQHFTPPRPFIDLSQAPDPAFHLVDMSLYEEKFLGLNHTHIFCSRGCIYDCAYCWDPVFHQRKHRKMDPEKVVDLMHRVVKDFGIKGISFGDDNFFIDLDWAHNILEKVVKSGLDVHIGKFFIRADTVCRLDKDFLDLMVRAGLRRLVIGAESGSTRILKLIKKRITIDEIVESNRKLLPYPIWAAYLFMLGLPTETPEDVEQTVRLADQLMRENPQSTRAFNIYTPFPGTELYDMVKKMGFPEPEKLEDWARFNYRNVYGKTPWISPETRKLVSILDYALMSSPRDNNLGKIRKDEPLSVMLARLYGPLARYRVKTMDTRFPIESHIIRLLRKLMGRDRV